MTTTIYSYDSRKADAGEVWGVIQETTSGKLHVVTEPGSCEEGAKLVDFKSIDNPGRGKRPEQWVKVDTGYVVTGFGKEYEINKKTRVNAYIAEAK